MNWIEYRINEARERKLTKLELDWDFLERDRPKPLPPEIFELSYLKSLTLKNFDLSELPEEIGAFGDLEELNLTQFHKVLLPRTLQRLKKLRKLTLLGIDLKEVPFDLGQLQELEEVNLSFNRLDDLPDGILKLEKLAKLDISQNSFSSPPKTLKKLGNLRELSIGVRTPTEEKFGPFMKVIERLNLTTLEVYGFQVVRSDINRLSEIVSLEDVKLYETGLTEFPIELARLPRLRALDLTEDANLEIPDAISSFQGLRKLSVQTSYKAEKGKTIRVSRSLLDLRRLESLKLHNRDLKLIYDGIFTLESLENLRLHDCGLRELPAKVESLAKLKNLDLGGNRLSNLPQELFRLEGLEMLWLLDTGIGRIPDEICNLSGLRELSLGSCGLSVLPAAVFRLKHLRRLDIQDNRLRELPGDICELKELECLRMAKNQIRELPKEVGLLSRLQTLRLEANPIESPPPEIVAQGLISIQDYFTALRETSVERLYEAKLLIVGEGAVGKTCLAKKLVEPECDLAQPKEKIRSTEGIAIRIWDVATSKTQHFRINLWDFGGQEIYHATHQFFLTKRSVYLFVWDARKEDRTGGFDYWLNVVRLLSGGSPVIIVLNKADERVREIDEAELKANFPNVQEFHKVSALTGAGMDVLRSGIKAAMAALPHIGDEWPVTWSGVRRALESEPGDYMSREEYELVCKAQHLPVSQVSSLASYLHDLGVILHFQDDPVLQRIVILKPEWGTNAVYKVLDTRKVQDAKGRFTMADLVEIWGNDKYPPSRHAELLHLMMKFELCFRLGDSGWYVAPELLSAEPPPLAWDTSNSLVFEYHYTFMPAGIITRFIARMHSAIRGDKYWRNGVVLEWRGAQALVVSEPLNRRIRISLVGLGRRELLSVIRHQIDEIHKTLNEPSVKEMVPCLCRECHKGNPHLFAHRTLEAYITKGIEEIRCEKSLENVLICDLLAEVLNPRAIGPDLPAAGSTYAIGTVQNLYVNNEKAMEENKPANRHASAAMPLFIFIVAVFGVLALACIGGGIYAIFNKAISETAFELWGFNLKTGHVGVAFVAIGLATALFTVRAVLKKL